MKKLVEVDVQIIKMRESSGNEQFFVRQVRNDNQSGRLSMRGVLMYSCWETKHLDKAKCLSRAWFDASFVAGFVGLGSMDEVILIGLDDDEIKILKSSRSMLHV